MQGEDKPKALFCLKSVIKGGNYDTHEMEKQGPDAGFPELGG
jgi:hypothetical protein